MSVASAATEAIFGAEPREISLLYTLFYIASSGNEQNPGTFERNFNTRGGGQQQRFVGGSQLVPLRMAQQLGGSVVLNTPVRAIDQARRRRDRDLGQGDLRRQARDRRHSPAARRPDSLLAAAAAPARPAHPADADGHADEGGGDLRQAVLARRRLHRPVRERDRPGEGDLRQLAAGRLGRRADGLHRRPRGAHADDRSRPTSSARPRSRASPTTSATRPSSRATSCSRTGPPRLGPAAARCRCSPPASLLDFGPALRTPVGSIHWAGTETSNYWNGYMDGAVRAGERAAAEVLAEI